MKLKLECGNYVVVNKLKNHPDRIGSGYVLEFDVGSGVTVLRISKGGFKIVANGYISRKALASVNELINVSDLFLHNIYMNTSEIDYKR